MAFPIESHRRQKRDRMDRSGGGTAAHAGRGGAPVPPSLPPPFPSIEIHHRSIYRSQKYIHQQ